jgi:predicted phosphodiesterase
MRAVIISDIHSNLQALEAVAKDIRKQAPDYIYCLGDIVGYGPQPCECIEWVRTSGKVNICILGNHDAKAFRYDNGEIAEGEFDERLNEFNLMAELALWHNAQLLSAADKEFLAKLPRQMSLCTGLTICHGSYTNPWQYIKDRFSAAVEAGQSPTPLTAVGHTHSPFVFVEPDNFLLPDGVDEFRIPVRKKSVINVGSVGQPRDGNHHACYVVVDFSPDKFICRFRRVSYNIAKTARLIRKMGIDEGITDQMISRLYKGK